MIASAGSEIGADRQPAVAPWDGSCRLWSLWDMVANFGFHSAHRVLTEIQFYIGLSKTNMAFVEENGGYSDPRVKNYPGAPGAISQAELDIQFIVNASVKIFSHLESSHVTGGIQRLRGWLDQDPKTWHSLNARCIALRDTVEIELKEHLYYQYPKGKGAKTLSWQHDWKITSEAFSAIDAEVFSAVDCYALGHNTASVFHCMRILERGLWRAR